MKLLTLAMFIFMSVLRADADEVTLRSKLSALSNLRYEKFVELSITFIEIGDFNYHHRRVIVSEKAVRAFTECVDHEYTPMYMTYGHDTEIGILFIGCAYKLGWMH